MSTLNGQIQALGSSFILRSGRGWPFQRARQLHISNLGVKKCGLSSQMRRLLFKLSRMI